ncbi:MAG: hypothetical protein R3348_07305 [Xanthomonadales bacterium]|nr:hypothetical protein [Xanthomonadales bacterium]
MRGILMMLAILLSATATAESRLPFLKDRVPEGTELPRPWGVGIDFYTMDQHYDIDFLSFEVPGVSLDDPSLLSVTNEVQHFDIKIDAWLLPFLNVFAVIGHLESDTTIDLSQAPVVGLPFPLGKLPVNTDGTVTGIGITLAYGGDNWFTTVTATRTDTDLGGSFESSVDSTTIQPRIGIVRGAWQAWVGGLYLDAEEKHRGTVELPVLGPVPFDVILGSSDEWNTTLGVRHVFSPHASLTLELGFGDREHTLFNYTYRF